MHWVEFKSFDSVVIIEVAPRGNKFTFEYFYPKAYDLLDHAWDVRKLVETAIKDSLLTRSEWDRDDVLLYNSRMDDLKLADDVWRKVWLGQVQY